MCRSIGTPVAERIDDGSQSDQTIPYGYNLRKGYCSVGKRESEVGELMIELADFQRQRMAYSSAVPLELRALAVHSICSQENSCNY